MRDVIFHGIELDAVDTERVARFWADLLGWRRDDGGPTLAPRGQAAWRLFIRRAGGPKRGQNRIHLDLTSESPGAMRETIERALELGASRTDVGQSPDEPHEVLADPEGNEFCVIQPGNRFLADTGQIGAINCDGTRAVGLFWSAALGWPLVWDEGQETAIQHPEGGTKITWSGPPLMPRHGRDRLRLVVRLAEGAELGAAIERLAALGATPLDGVPAGPGARLTDPDGNEFLVLASSGE